MRVPKKILICLSFFALVVAGISWQKDAPSYVHEADMYFGKGNSYNLGRAADLYNKALNVDPLVPHALHQLARIDFLHGDFDSALEKINRQIEIHGTDFMASYYIRGLIHGYRKEFPEAEQDFKTFLEWDPENWAALNDLAWVYFAQGKFSDAKNTAETGLAVNPNSPWLLTMRGMSRYNQGDREGAVVDLGRAKVEASRLEEADWSRAYPGNDPAIASAGLSAMRKAIDDNIERVNRNLAPSAQ
jgi:tetratricopeptide (TPR) repeat protein